MKETNSAADRQPTRLREDIRKDAFTKLTSVKCIKASTHAAMMLTTTVFASRQLQDAAQTILSASELYCITPAAGTASTLKVRVQNLEMELLIVILDVYDNGWQIELWGLARLVAIFNI
jgi:hypothetical protein